MMAAYDKKAELLKELGNLLDAGISAAKRGDWAAALREVQQANRVADELPKKGDNKNDHHHHR